MNLFSKWQVAKNAQAAARREAEAQRAIELRDSITQLWHDNFRSVEAAGFVRACTNLHWTADYAAAGGYVLTPTKQLVLMTAHRGGAVHFSNIEP